MILDKKKIESNREITPSFQFTFIKEKKQEDKMITNLLI